jgi:hypothetical protein
VFCCDTLPDECAIWLESLMLFISLPLVVLMFVFGLYEGVSETFCTAVVVCALVVSFRIADDILVLFPRAYLVETLDACDEETVVTSPSDTFECNAVGTGLDTFTYAVDAFVLFILVVLDAVLLEI